MPSVLLCTTSRQDNGGVHSLRVREAIQELNSFVPPSIMQLPGDRERTDLTITGGLAILSACMPARPGRELPSPRVGKWTRGGATMSWQLCALTVGNETTVTVKA